MAKTTVQLEETTRNRLKRLGKMDETMDDLLNRLAEMAEGIKQ